MRRICIITLVLLTILSSTAFAGLDWSGLVEGRHHRRHEVPKDWPMPVVVGGDYVNLRAEPNTTSDVIEVLVNGEKIYIEDFVGENLIESYAWASVITENGNIGYVNAKFLNHPTDGMTREGRFKALFDSSVFFDFEKLVAANRNVYDINPQKVNKYEGYPYSDRKFSIANGRIWAHGYNFYANFVQIAAEVRKSGYVAAGLEVGQVIVKNQIKEFSQDMKSMGWNPSKTENETYSWVLIGDRGDNVGPIKSFGFKLNDNKIEEIYWMVHLVD